MSKHGKALIGLLASLMFAVPLSAEPVNTGRQVADQKCAGCHAIGEKDASADPKAPPLRTLNTRYPIDALKQNFLNGMEVGHRGMPAITLSPQEVDDLLSYLRSLDPCGKPSSDKDAMARCFAPMKQ